jgi:hypothetical protein
MGMIFILRRGDVMSILLQIISFLKLNILGKPLDGWPEMGGQRRF